MVVNDIIARKPLTQLSGEPALAIPALALSAHRARPFSLPCSSYSGGSS